MDIQCANIIDPVVTRLKLSSLRYKVLCIPGYMGSEWLPAAAPLLQIRGLIVVLCNHPGREGGRKSFIRDASGQMLVARQDGEPLYRNFE
jgi:hypothetical protein